MTFLHQPELSCANLPGLWIVHSTTACAPASCTEARRLSGHVPARNCHLCCAAAQHIGLLVMHGTMDGACTNMH